MGVPSKNHPAHHIRYGSQQWQQCLGRLICWINVAAYRGSDNICHPPWRGRKVGSQNKEKIIKRIRQYWHHYLLVPVNYNALPLCLLAFSVNVWVLCMRVSCESQNQITRGKYYGLHLINNTRMGGHNNFSCGNSGFFWGLIPEIR